MIRQSDDIRLSRDHPYLRNMDLRCFETGNGKWRMKWRDFGFHMNDADFLSEEEALEFKNEVWSEAHIVDKGYFEGIGLNFDDLEHEWCAIEA